MPGLVELIQLAQNSTWLMVVLLWLGTGLAYRSITTDIGELATQHETLDSNVDQVGKQVNRVDQKQDHIVNRQEMILERLGMNTSEIQELREETARLDEKHQAGSDFYRRSGDPSGDD